jgi:hypothetical protein
MHVRSCVLLLVACLVACLLGAPVLAQDVNQTNTVNSLPNDPTIGTRLNRLAKITPANTLIQASTTDTAIPLVVVIGGAGTTGTAVYVEAGNAYCLMDNATTNKAGPHIIASTSADAVGNGGGRCHQQDAEPTNGMSLGSLMQATTLVDGLARISVRPIAYKPGSGAGTGSVTSVDLTMPSEFIVGGTHPVVASGTIAITEATQTAGTVYAGPPSGGAAAPGYRALVPTDITAALGGTTAAGDLAGAYPAPTIAKVSGAFVLPGILVPSALIGDAHNYSPTGFATASTVLMDGGATDRNVTGFAAQGNGDLKKICNNGGTNALVLKPDHAGSLATNRLQLPSDVTMPPGVCTTLWYGTAAGRWQLSEGAAPDYLKVRSFGVIVGDPDVSAVLLVDGNDTPRGFNNHYGRLFKVLSLACYADVGTPKIQVTLAGTNTSLIVDADGCTCGNGDWLACNVVTTTTAVLQSWQTTATTRTCPVAPCGLDIRVQAVGTSGAHYINVDGKGLLQ